MVCTLNIHFSEASELIKYLRLTSIADVIFCARGVDEIPLILSIYQKVLFVCLVLLLLLFVCLLLCGVFFNIF